MTSPEFVTTFSSMVYAILFIALICAGIGLCYFLMTGRHMKF